jgi:phytoene/squalene synthetase
MTAARSDSFRKERFFVYVTENFELTAAETSYLDRKLRDVSRSFALVVPFLETPLQQYLATAYLLCRVVDNIEDSGQNDDWKNERFGEFSRLLREPQRAAHVLEYWERETWPPLTNAERQMMGVDGGLVLWQIYAAIPQATQDTIRLWAGIMAEGMQLLGDPHKRPYLIQRDGKEILNSEEDYNQYCYFVAGTVGHLVTELVILHYQFSDDVAQFLRARAEACGRALQKTNIVKDFVQDLKRGICYLPDVWLREVEYAPLALQGAAPEWKAMVIGDVLDELSKATAYLSALPHSAKGYRHAALLCLLPAYQTLLSAAQQQETLFTPAHHIKISRQTMAQCLADSQALLFDDEAIRQYARRIGAEIYDQFKVPDYQ